MMEFSFIVEVRIKARVFYGCFFKKKIFREKNSAVAKSKKSKKQQQQQPLSGVLKNKCFQNV